MKKTWAVLSEILNRKNRNSVLDNITVNGAECSDKQAIAEHFNSFFASVGELNSKNIIEHGDSSYRDYLSERIESNFEFRLVTPIYKKDDKKIITKYRPISVLPVVSKVFETVIHEQLSDYFLSNNLFSAQQYGFRNNSSTQLAALELIDRLLAQLKITRYL